MADAAHSRFGGSVIGRVIACPGSVALCATVPNLSSDYAKEGTRAHVLAEHMLKRQETDASAYIGMTVFPENDRDEMPITKDMADAVQVYIDTVAEDYDALPEDTELYVEHKFVLDISTAEPGEVFGSNDCMLYSATARKMIVYDYKHGAGVPVAAVGNKQLMFYAVGAINEHPSWPIDELEVVIVQPRARDDEGDGVKRWTVDIVELFDFISEIETAVKDAKAGAAALKTGDHCRWCPAKALCPQQQSEALQAFDGVVNPAAADLPAPSTLDAERISEILIGGAKLMDWYSEVQKFAEAFLVSGGEIPGFKLVNKIGRRKWVDSDEEISAYLSMYGLDEDTVRPRKLITLTEAEKLLKQAGAKDAIEGLNLNYTIKESSGVTMAPASDRREAVNLAQQAFKDVDLG